MKLRTTLFILLTALVAQAQIIHRVEPPNWWTDMQWNHLQLLVYGDSIAYLQPQIDSKGVVLQQTTYVKNPNYLFLDIAIEPHAEPGKIPIVFYQNGRQVHTHYFDLLQRTPGSAQRKGFDTSDVLYLITPDRFANADPTNDDVAGMKETADRTPKFGRHGGDLQGIENHLDYIADLGFTAIWLNPVLENDMPKWSYHGYAATDFYKVDQRFGTNESYRQFCRKANEKGLKVIMDMIVNHSGSHHWFVLDPPTSDWLNFQDKYEITSHKRTTIQDIHASEYDKKAFSDGWFVPTMPDLNQRNKWMASYLIQNAIWWIEYAGISGIRMDTYPYPDKDFMSEWTCAVTAEYPGFNIVGEEWSINPAIVSYWQAEKVNHDGYTSCLPSLMDFPLQDALVKSLTEKENWNSGWIKVYEALANDFLYADPNQLVVFPDNHDMDRFFTQVDNDFDLFKMGMVYFATIRGIPQFYYGTEVLMQNDSFPGDHGIIRTDFPGGWAGDPVNAFTGKGLSDQQKEAQAFTKKLLNWRKNKTVIHQGRLIQFAPKKGIYAYFRFDDKETVMVLFNKNDQPIEVDLERFAELLSGHHKATEVLTNRQFILSTSILVPPRTALVLEIE